MFLKAYVDLTAFRFFESTSHPPGSIIEDMATASQGCVKRTQALQELISFWA